MHGMHHAIIFVLFTRNRGVTRVINKKTVSMQQTLAQGANTTVYCGTHHHNTGCSHIKEPDEGCNL